MEVWFAQLHHLPFRIPECLLFVGSNILKVPSQIVKFPRFSLCNSLLCVQPELQKTWHWGKDYLQKHFVCDCLTRHGEIGVSLKRLFKPLQKILWSHPSTPARGVSQLQHLHNEINETGYGLGTGTVSGTFGRGRRATSLSGRLWRGSVQVSAGSPQYPNSAFQEIPMVPIVTYLVFLSHTEAIDYPDL